MNDIYDKFPPERKDEFLNWLMLAREKGEWCHKAGRYIHHHQIRDWYEGFQFVVQWAPDKSFAAHWMMKHGYAESEWVMKVIENYKTGDRGSPVWIAYLMVSDKQVPQEWYDKILKEFS